MVAALADNAEIAEALLAAGADVDARDEAGQWWRAYGNELWEFDADGYMARREASINDIAIPEDELRVTPGTGELPT